MEKDLQHSIDYITQKVGEKSGFKTPENYFQQVESTIITKLSEENLPKKSSFDVPKDYFTTLEDNIFAKITSKEKNHPKKKEAKVISLKDRIVKMIPVAAAASIVLFAFTFILKNYNNTTSFEDITASDIEVWYENGYGNTNNTELALILNTDDFSENELSSININDTNIEDYLNSVDDYSLFNDIQ